MKQGAIKSYRDLKVFQLSHSSAMEVFNLTKRFPREELYSLTDQIRRASRSVSSNIVEGWASVSTKISSKGSWSMPSGHARKRNSG